MNRRVLFLGGTGAVGGRIAHLLAGLPDIEFLIAARDMERADQLVDDLHDIGVAARAVDMSRMDGMGDLLSRERPVLVIDATGPFQLMDHAHPRACIAAGIPCIDVADSSAYVLGVRALDAAAIDQGVTVLSGAGLVPCLSMAASAALAQGLNEVHAVHVAVCPGNQEQHGHAAISGMLAAAGQPFSWRKEGEFRPVHGWQGLSQIELPGQGRRWLSAWEVPDLDLLLERWPGLRDATVHGSVEVAVLHLGLWALGWLPRLGIKRDITGLVPVAEAVARSFAHFGTDRFAMRVEMEGTLGKHRIHRTWTMLGSAAAGNWVRAAPAAAIARAILTDQPQHPGARVASLTLSEILAELQRTDIEVRVSDMDE